MKRFIKTYFFAFLFVVCLGFINAQSTNVKGLFSYKLDNGLELFVMENDSAPLAFIEIAAKAGAVYQTKENAGLFHLYEHLMFKGNSLYSDSQKVQTALTKLGVTDWNGSTSTDYVNYYFTIPKDKLKEGLLFWSSAIRTPLLDAQEVEREKQVVIAEIQGNYSNPPKIAYSAICRAMFPEKPWKLDSGGSLESIKNATVASLKQIKDVYYVPDNCAVFVGGDVEHTQVFEAVKEIFGEWKPSKTKPAPLNAPTKTPVKNNKFMVFANEQIPVGMTSVYYCLRGPDTIADMNDTYGADLFISLCNNPTGAIKRAMLKDKKLIFLSQEYFDFSYSTQKATGQMTFSGMLANVDQKGSKDGFENSAKRAKYFAQEALPALVKNILSSKTYFPKEEMQQAKATKIKEQKYATESASGYLSILQYWWNVCDFNYALNYYSKFNSMDKKDVDAFLKKYISGKTGVVFVQVNPQTFEQEKEAFAKEGFEVVTPDNAFWFSQATK